MRHFYFSGFFIIYLSTTFSCSVIAQNFNCIKELEIAVRKVKNRDSLDLTIPNCISWDSLMVIAPEFSRNLVEINSGISLPAEVSYDFYATSSKFWWMIFLRNGKFVTYIKVEQDNFSFNDLMMKSDHRWDFFTIARKDCVFDFYTRNDYFFANSKKKILLVKLRK